MFCNCISLLCGFFDQPHFTDEETEAQSLNEPGNTDGLEPGLVELGVPARGPQGRPGERGSQQGLLPETWPSPSGQGTTLSW